MSKLIARIKHELRVYRLIIKDDRTPRVAKFLMIAAVFYMVSPIDLIPDVIPIIGFLDDIIIVPGLVILALKLIPKQVVEECRVRAAAA